MHARAPDSRPVSTHPGSVAVLLSDRASEMTGEHLAGRHRPDGHTDTVVDQLVGIGLPVGQQDVNGWAFDPIECIGR